MSEDKTYILRKPIKAEKVLPDHVNVELFGYRQRIGWMPFNEQFMEFDVDATRKLIKQILLDNSKPGDTVYDPFIGSGTTALACKDLGRNYIGSEISAEYCEIAESRLAQGVLDLFTESVVEPVELGEE